MRTITVDVNADLLADSYKWQRDLYRAKQRHRIAVVSRRAGKTRTGAKICVGALLRGKKILWVAPAYKQLPENFEQVRQQLDDFGLIKKTLHNEQIKTLTGGTINFDQAANYASLRGGGYDYILFDEMAFSHPEAWTVLRPTLADHGTGRLIALSTPNGFNHFHKLFTVAKENPSEWYVVQAGWECSKHLLPAEMESLRREIGESRFLQEMCALFQSPSGAIFPHDWIEHLLVDEIPKAFDWSCISVDLSHARSHVSDWQAVCFVGFERSSSKYYADIRQERMPLPVLFQCMKQLYDLWQPTVGFIIEKNGFEKDIDEFSRIWTPHQPPKIARFTAQESKPIRINSMSPILERRELSVKRSPGAELLWQQLSVFGAPGQGTVAQGFPGDDGPDSLAQGIAYHKVPKKQIR